MADGFRIDIEGHQASQLKAAAEARGVDPETYARQLLEHALENEVDRVEIASRMRHYHETGEYIDHAEVIELLRKRARGESPA